MEQYKVDIEKVACLGTDRVEKSLCADKKVMKADLESTHQSLHEEK